MKNNSGLHKLVFWACLLLASASAQARHGHLVELGRCYSEQIELYRKSGVVRSFLDCTPITNRLRSGDLVHFSDGQSFTLMEKVAQGSSSFFWSVKEQPGFLLRLPRGEQYDINAMADFKTGWKEFKDLGVPVVDLIDTGANNLEYALVKRHKFVTKIDRFAQAEWNAIAQSPQSRRALVQFAVKSFRLAETSQEFQIGFDGKDWVAFDLGANNKSWLSNPLKLDAFYQSPWKQFSGSSTDFFAELHDIVVHERESQCENALVNRDASPL